MAYTSGAVVDVPFETWNLGTTPDDPSDDVRMINWMYDINGNDLFDYSGDDASSLRTMIPHLTGYIGETQPT